MAHATLGRPLALARLLLCALLRCCMLMRRPGIVAYEYMYHHANYLSLLLYMYIPAGCRIRLGTYSYLPVGPRYAAKALFSARPGKSKERHKQSTFGRSWRGCQPTRFAT
jgi:hypothetical protein